MNAGRKEKTIAFWTAGHSDNYEWSFHPDCIALLKTQTLFGHSYLCNYCGNDDKQIESHCSQELDILGIQSGS